MLFKSLHLKNILSFRDTELDIGPMNILIGPNASGKSNLIETLALLQAIPSDLAGFFRRNGPILDWIWKGDAVPSINSDSAEILAVLDNPAGMREAEKELTYDLQLAANNDRLQVISEKLENIRPYETYQANPYYYFLVENGDGPISTRRSSDDRGERPDSYENPRNGLTTSGSKFGADFVSDTLSNDATYVILSDLPVKTQTGAQCYQP